MLVYFAIVAFVALLSVIFRVAAALRLTVPLLYALVAPTLFAGWFHANSGLANFIGWALVVLAGLSWVVSLVRKVKEKVDDYRAERIIGQMLVRRASEAAEFDENGYCIVNVEGLFPD